MGPQRSESLSIREQETLDCGMVLLKRDNMRVNIIFAKSVSRVMQLALIYMKYF